MKRILYVLLILPLIGFLGCSLWSSQNVRSQSPEEKLGYGTPEKPRLVGDIASPFGLHALPVEGVAIVTGLDDTGSDPPLTKFRQMLYRDLKKRGVADPSPLLASKSTSLVLVRSVIPPGSQKGERIDIEVQTPSGSETTSLRGGWLMETDLKEMKYMGNELRSGDTMAIATGTVMTPPRKGDEKSDAKSQLKGLVLGGGAVQQSRKLGLILPNEDKFIMARYADMIQKAINKRFHFTARGGSSAGVAKAKDNRFIEVNVHPRYKNNVYRYMAVIRAVALVDNEQVRLKRLGELRIRLKDPFTSAYAALELEAMGAHDDVLDILREGMNSSDVQVQFYSAETLAFLDQSECAATLARIAKQEDALRGQALGALAALDDINSYEVLIDLMKSGSYETRYSAFRSLWYMRPGDPIARGENMGRNEFTLHYVESESPNLIHITKDTRAEIVLFGSNIKFNTPLLLDVGKNIMLKSDGGDVIEVSKFSVNEPDQKRTISSDVADVIRTVSELGATYPDVVEMIQAAVANGTITTKVLVNAVPKSGRVYRTRIKSSGDSAETESAGENVQDNSIDEVSDEDRRLAGETPPEDAKPDKIEKEHQEETDTDTHGHQKLSNPKPWYKLW